MLRYTQIVKPVSGKIQINEYIFFIYTQRTHAQTKGQAHGHMNGQTNLQSNGRTNRQTNGTVKEQIK